MFFPIVMPPFEVALRMKPVSGILKASAFQDQ